MKKILLFLLPLVMFASCKDKCQFNKVLANDYKEIVAEYPDAEGGFVEAEIELTDSIHAANPKKVDVSSVKTMFQAEDTLFHKYVIFRERTAGNEPFTYTKAGMWVGSGEFDLSIIKYTLTEALRLLKKSGYELPETVFVVLRWPLSGRYEHPIYIFGSKHTFYLFVDAVTGEVGEVYGFKEGKVAEEA